MEQTVSASLKRVKTNSNSKIKTENKDFEFNFDLFFGDIQDGQKPLRSKFAKDFYSLFDSNKVPAKNRSRFAEIKSIVFLTFSVSRELLKPLLEEGFPVILASDCSINIEKAIINIDEEYPHFVKFFPRKKYFPYSCSSFHPKLILIRFSSFLRVVVGSGNLLEQDWIVWENVFLQKDFPLAGKVKQSTLSNQIDEYLSFVFEDKANFIKSFAGLKIHDFDLSESQFYLISSLPGRWSNKDTPTHGYGEVRRVMLANPPKNDFTIDNMSIHYLTSSIGQLNWKLITDFASCFFPPSAQKSKLTFDEKDKLLQNFNVIFPSKKFVDQSKFGPKTASCLFFDKDTFESFKFLKSALKQYHKNNEDESLIPHIKMFVVSNSGRLINDDTVIYIGSHNFTPAAWGKFEHDSSWISINNYELGILIPPLKSSAKAKQALISQFDINFQLKGFDKYDEPYFSKR